MHQCLQAYFFWCRLPSLTARQCVHHSGIGASPPGGGFLSWVTRATCPFFKTRCQPAPPGPPGGRGLEKASLQASFAIEGSSKKKPLLRCSTQCHQRAAAVPRAEAFIARTLAAGSGRQVSPLQLPLRLLSAWRSWTIYEGYLRPPWCGLLLFVRLAQCSHPTVPTALQHHLQCWCQHQLLQGQALLRRHTMVVAHVLWWRPGNVLWRLREASWPR